MTVEAKLWWMIYVLRGSIALDWGKLATESPVREERRQLRSVTENRATL